MKITHKKNHFKGHGETQIFWQAWEFAKGSKARIVFIHGMSEHSGRYEFPVRYFTECGFDVYAMDLRGHGRSGGRRAYADTLEDFIEDIRIFIEKVRKNTRKKVFLVGHSFGGQLVLNYGLHYPDTVDGIVASSPNIRLKLPIHPLKLFLAPFLSRIFPKLSLPNDIDPSYVSRNQETVMGYFADPQVLRKITTRLANLVLRNQDQLVDFAKDFRVPCLLMHAGDDKICCPSGTEDFFRKIPIRDKQMKVYKDYYHEIFNEEENHRTRVFADMEKWMEKRL